MAVRDVTATHSARLALQEERAGMQEGYRFLDEKRLILAAELLAQLHRYERDRDRLRELEQTAREALIAAIRRHGLEGLSLHPAPSELTGNLDMRSRSVLGVSLREVEGLRWHAATPAPPAIDPSPEAEACRTAFAALLPVAAELAATGRNLRRLHREYARTARRARALEDVLLPEVDETLRAVDTALEEHEREEAIRARRLRA